MCNIIYTAKEYYLSISEGVKLSSRLRQYGLQNLIICILCVISSVCNGNDAPPTLSIQDLSVLSLEELMDVSVVTSSKKQKRQFDESSSIFVITQKDISRSGVTSLPEALRLAPGVHVARINANQWAISIHGFNERFSNKLLVLIDGRSVYSPLSSGVYWDAQEVLLENVDRIEVVRGPGATLWGSNAVNGVINVITYSAQDTQGTQVIAGYGSEEQGFGSLRFGGSLGENTHYRVHGKYANRDEGGEINQQPPADNSSLGSAGFRIDSKLAEHHNLLITGNLYDGKSGQAGNVPDINSPTLERFTNLERFINDDIKFKGQNILARWSNEENNGNGWSLQAYYDHTSREDSVLGDQEVNSTDLDFQHRFDWLFNQQLAWGVQYRYVNNKLDAGTLVSLAPRERNTHLYSGFVSDEISLFQDQLMLTLASRFEHNDLTGFEIQPTARASWLINPSNTLWGAISRSVKVPSISEHDSVLVPSIINLGVTGVIEFSGDSDFETEKIVSYELGYRAQLSQYFKFDISAFYNDYDDLRTFEAKDNFVLQNPLRLIVPIEFDNKMKGYSYGLDLSANWFIQSWWNVNAGYSYSKTRLKLKNGSNDTFSLILPAIVNSPEQMFSLRSSWNVRNNWKLDLWMRYVDRLESTSVDSYFNADARVAWKMNDNLELSVIGQNLLDKQIEFTQDNATNMNNSEVQRSVYFKMKLTF